MWPFISPTKKVSKSYPLCTHILTKNFKGNTVINQYSYHTAPPANLHRTVLEDVDFEKKFEVFTNDDVEARYLITPSLMERLKSMQVAFKTDKISAAFYKNKLHAPIRDEDWLPWGDSRSTPRSMSALERNPQFPALTPHMVLGPSIDGRGIPRGPWATRMGTGLSWGNQSGSLRSPS